MISDINIYLFIEKEMRDGISYISNRYNKVNDTKEKSLLVIAI